uniref:Uncharacterized protein n=1 Tax=Romanomermis culicivorax TaxID=13658 RepID=A0A915HM68_ROMCU
MVHPMFSPCFLEQKHSEQGWGPNLCKKCNPEEGLCKIVHSKIPNIQKIMALYAGNLFIRFAASLKFMKYR